jgi:hypothetical protein
MNVNRWRSRGMSCALVTLLRHFHPGVAAAPGFMGFDVASRPKIPRHPTVRFWHSRFLCARRQLGFVVSGALTSEGQTMEHLELRSFVSRDERRPVNLRGFALSDTRDSDVVLSDLSYGGCQIRSADTFERGETFELRVLKRGASHVEVCWVRDDCAGARFVGGDVQPEQSGI